MTTRAGRGHMQSDRRSAGHVSAILNSSACVSEDLKRYRTAARRSVSQLCRHQIYQISTNGEHQISHSLRCYFQPPKKRKWPKGTAEDRRSFSAELLGP